MNLKFKLNKQKLIRLDNEEIATYSRNFVNVSFDFDEVWYDLKKYALFVTPLNNRYIVKLGYGKKLSCYIPDEVLKNAFFKISVFADDLLTSTQETVLVSSSGYISDIDNMEEEDVLESQKNWYNEPRGKHYDEDYNERINRFEIEEHKYC